MSYVVNRYNDNVLTVVSDYTVDETLDIKLIGRHYIDYGEIQNENFVFLLENFSNPSPPEKAISGQLWFDSYQNKLNVFDGDKFSPVGLPNISTYQPMGLKQGEMWWDTVNEQLHAFNGHDFIMIGPEHDKLEDIDFVWEESERKLSIRITTDSSEEYVLIGPEIGETLAISHIL